ncbi:MAG TPA: DUF5666 domain-containing protein [Anaerolineae bacterium]|nr:DUF5666 domain-containing protein [Anaerolineae bacterium]
MKRPWLLAAAIALVVLAAGAAFYGGLKLGQAQAVEGPGPLASGEGWVDLPAGEWQFPSGGPGGQFPGGRGTPGAGRPGGGQGMPSADTITAIDGNTITLNTADGTQKVIVSDTTYIQKYMSVTVADLAQGDTVVVSGSKNDDGSISARSIRVMTGLGFAEDRATPTP